MMLATSKALVLLVSSAFFLYSTDAFLPSSPTTLQAVFSSSSSSSSSSRLKAASAYVDQRHEVAMDVDVDSLHYADLRFIFEASNNRRGDGCPKPFHLHIGAGKLGLGLLVPAICRSGTPLAILQRPSEAFHVMQDSSHVNIEVNGELICENMQVVRSLSDISDTDSSASDSMLVLSDDQLLLNILVNSATSFSMSLGEYIQAFVFPSHFVVTESLRSLFHVQVLT